jgi:hypothetical protein
MPKWNDPNNFKNTVAENKLQQRENSRNSWRLLLHMDVLPEVEQKKKAKHYSPRSITSVRGGVLYII